MAGRSCAYRLVLVLLLASDPQHVTVALGASAAFTLLLRIARQDAAVAELEEA